MKPLKKIEKKIKQVFLNLRDGAIIAYQLGLIMELFIEQRQKIKEELLAEFPKDEIKPDWKKGYKDEKMKGYWEGVSDGFNQACREHREVVEKLLKE